MAAGKWIVRGTLLAGIAGIVWLWWAEAPSAPAPAAPQAATEDAIMTDDNAARFPDAPPEVRDLAAAIATGGPVDPTGLDPRMLNQFWSRAWPAAPASYGHSLLREAVLSGNVAAARALIGAGADPFYNGNEMAFQAGNLKARGPRVWWPDYATGNALLRLWLDAGGDPNTVNPAHDSTGALLSAVAPDNLEGKLMLLAAGADPWFEMPADPGDPDGFRYASFHEMNANASVPTMELAFRVALEGHYRGGPEAVIDKVVQSYETTAENYAQSTGPEAMRLIWGLQQVIPPAFEQMGRVPAGDTALILAKQVPDDLGGFFLAPGEVRSPDDPDQLVRTDNQWGTERWNDR